VRTQPINPKNQKDSDLIFIQHKRFGDDVQAVPCLLFTKARTIGDEYALVLPINYDRHFGPAFNQLLQEKDGFTDFPFLDKISKVKKERRKKGKPGARNACRFLISILSTICGLSRI